MKRMIRKKLSLIILAAILVSLLFNYAVQTRGARRDMLLTSQELFWQIQQILEQNAAETKQIEHDFKESCLVRAKAAAYIVQSRHDIVGHQAEMEKVANLLDVDEFHLFDPDGTLYGGSQPKYFGLNFRSGEQMQFFLPMLSDRSLELCQDITPNTAEQKLMQYAAVWREDGEGIVQIGMTPGRVLEAKKKNELSYIFSLLTADSGAAIYAIDAESYEVLGSTDPDQLGKTAGEIGIDPKKIPTGQEVLRATVAGRDSCCAFSFSGPVILVRTHTIDSLYQSVNQDTLLLALYLLLGAVILLFMILHYLDSYIISGIAAVNHKLMTITGGDLDAVVEVRTTPEFAELSGHINSMVRSLLDMTNKLSEILEIVRIPIGVYEYNQGMKRVLATSRIADILRLSEGEAEGILADHTRFEAALAEIRRRPVDPERGIYEIPGPERRFVRMESFSRGHSTLGIVLDVTEDIAEKQRIEYERDVDQLTGLYNRRAFYRNADLLFRDAGRLGQAVLIMIDSDNLKQVNDRYGHENGDRYLQMIAGLLQSLPAEKKLTARLSGDEFVLLVYGCASRQELDGAIRRLGRSMKGCSLPLDGGRELPVSFSAGCAFFPEDGDDFHILLKRADDRMYRSKQQSKQNGRMWESS